MRCVKYQWAANAWRVLARRSVSQHTCKQCKPKADGEKDLIIIRLPRLSVDSLGRFDAGLCRSRLLLVRPMRPAVASGQKRLYTSVPICRSSSCASMRPSSSLGRPLLGRLQIPAEWKIRSSSNFSVSFWPTGAKMKSKFIVSPIGNYSLLPSLTFLVSSKWAVHWAPLYINKYLGRWLLTEKKYFHS